MYLVPERAGNLKSIIFLSYPNNELLSSRSSGQCGTIKAFSFGGCCYSQPSHCWTTLTKEAKHKAGGGENKLKGSSSCLFASLLASFAAAFLITS